MTELLVIIGPPAVGKMSVGKAVCDLTGYKLFYNHMSIEPVLGIFDWSTPQFKKLVKEFRTRIFEEAADSDLPGLVFTYVWAFDDPSDKEYLDDLCRIFQQKGVQPYFVELKADLSQRLERNRHPDRLMAKASKRDVALSEQRMLEHVERHTFNTDGDFHYPDHHLQIDNTDLSPEDVAEKIVAHFSLKRA